jgi:hypothetical protein
MKNLGLITRVGPTSRPGRAPETTIPFRIEVEKGDGPEIPSLSPSAAAVLRGELNQYLETHGFR